MKTRLLLLLALLIALITCTAYAAADLPQVGDVIEGFEVKEIRESPIYGADLIYMQHEKTGAGLLYIHNDDTNRFFGLAFRTQAIDNTGLPHVFEHATTNGSEKYPSSALFFNLNFQTYMTYMNAMTADRLTVYPIGSLSEEQLLKIADFYVDSCFHPMVLKDESIYREEAWRYRLESEDAPLTLEGTVYSEMLGARTLNRVAAKNWVQTTFPGSFLGFEQGGDPDFIPDMTWEDLKAYHERFYHPSNCTAYLYGDLDNYVDFLALLNQEFSNYDAREFTVTDENYVPLTESVEAEHAFPMEAGSDENNKTAIHYAFPLHADANADRTELNYLSSLLSNDSSPLVQRLKEVLPSGFFYAGLEVAGPTLAFDFSISNVNREDKALFVDTVNTVLAEILTDGFDADMIDGIIASIELDTLLSRENNNLGASLPYYAAYYEAVTGNIFSYFEEEEASSQLMDWYEQGIFTALIEKYLTPDKLHTVDVTYPVAGLKEEKEAEKAALLESIKESMSPEERAALIQASTSEDEETDAVDTTAMVQSLKAVDVSTLPEEIRLYEVQDETNELGIRHIQVPASVSQVLYTDLRLNVDHLSAEELQYLKLYKDLIDYLDTTEHSQAELSTLQLRYLYQGNIGISLTIEGVPYLSFNWMARVDDLEKGYDVMREAFFELDVENTEKLQNAIQALLTNARTSINSSPYSVLIYAALGRSSALYRQYSYITGLPYYTFLTGVSETMNNDPQTVVDQLLAIRKRVKTSHGSIAIMAGDPECEETSVGLSNAWLLSLGNDVPETKSRDIEPIAQKTALIVDSQVQYNGYVADFETLGLDGYDAGLDVLATLVNDRFLIPLLREQYGVYTPMHSAIDRAGVYIMTYRDPNLTETYAVYAQLADLLDALEIDQETLDGYILSSYSNYALSSGELSGAISAASKTINEIPQEYTIEKMRELKAVTPEKIHSYANLYRKLCENGIMVTAGGAGIIEENADLFDVILNPFNATDPSAVEMTDVTEALPEYEAIRYVFAQGLMTLTDDQAFAPDADATVGTLAGAIYALLGGSTNPEEGTLALQQYGIVSTGLNASNVLTRRDAADTLGNLMLMSGMDLTAEAPDTLSDPENANQAFIWCLANGLLDVKDGKAAPDDTMTRKELAQLLYVLVAEE